LVDSELKDGLAYHSIASLFQWQLQWESDCITGESLQRTELTCHQCTSWWGLHLRGCGQWSHT